MKTIKISKKVSVRGRKRTGARKGGQKLMLHQKIARGMKAC